MIARRQADSLRWAHRERPPAVALPRARQRSGCAAAAPDPREVTGQCSPPGLRMARKSHSRRGRPFRSRICVPASSCPSGRDRPALDRWRSWTRLVSRQLEAAFRGDGNQVVHDDGTHLASLPPGSWGKLSWSPDSKRVAFTGGASHMSNGDVFVARSNGTVSSASFTTALSAMSSPLAGRDGVDRDGLS